MRIGWPERLFSRCDPQENGCILWTGTRTNNGYGVVSRRGRTVLAHRAMYEELIGPIPKGMEIDHTCRQRACVNVAHMEVVTHQENTLRGNTIAAANAAKTHCPAGHAYSTANTKWEANRRRCRICSAETKRRWKQRQRAD